MTRLTLLRGYPGSGKSTLARYMADTEGYTIVNRDSIRQMMFGVAWTGKDEDEQKVTVAERAQVMALLNTGFDVLVDACHVNSTYVKQWAKLASERSAEFDIVDVRTDWETCVMRDKLRDRQVGEQVIRRMAKRFPMSNWPSVDRVRVKPIMVEPVEYDPNLPEAVIVDIDGTLTTGPKDRSPYDYSKVSQDEVRRDMQWVLEGVNHTSRTRQSPCVLIVSGRDDSCYTATMNWLQENRIRYDFILMRPAEAKDSNGNKLPDFVVKLNLFNEHIRGKYNVRAVFDDRDQVVRLWRQLGLTCLQVAPGAF